RGARRVTVRPVRDVRLDPQWHRAVAARQLEVGVAAQEVRLAPQPSLQSGIEAHLVQLTQDVVRPPNDQIVRGPGTAGEPGAGVRPPVAERPPAGAIDVGPLAGQLLPRWVDPVVPR